MNEIQYNKLLNLRGFTKVVGISRKASIYRSGGEPSDKEMVEVNKQSMIYYMEKFIEQKELNKKLKIENNKLQESEEEDSLDNWEGYDIAIDLEK